MKWNDVNKVLPDKDGEYLVVLKWCPFPCALYFDSRVGVFHDEDHEVYESVTHWVESPIKVSDIENFDNDSLVTKEASVLPFPGLGYCIEFSFEEAIVHREHLQFILQYYSLLPFLEKSFEELLSKIKNVLGDKE